MPRANRYFVAGPAFHVTHRCHNREFLFRYAKDRDVYREMMRQQLNRNDDISLLTYCITSNHVHMLLVSRSKEGAVSDFMQALQGQFAQEYNRSKNRSGAFWGDRFHATMVDSGEYLWQCMRYIDLNMVRAGVVPHPAQWSWCGYGDIVGIRKRYRTVDMDELCRRTDQSNATTLSSWYGNWIDEASAREAYARDAKWTDSIAVGSRLFAENMGRMTDYRMKIELVQHGST